MFKLPEREQLVTKHTGYAPHLIQIRTVLEIAGLMVLAMALWKVGAQRRMIRRLIDARIARGDGERRMAVRHG